MLLAIIGIFNSCEKEDVILLEENNSAIPEEILMEIQEMGFDISTIQDIGDRYLLENDITLSKSRFERKSEISVAGDSVMLKQARVSGLIAPENRTFITVFVNSTIPTSGTDNWRNEVQAACNHWNSITNTSIYLRYVTSGPADITIRADNNVLNDGAYFMIDGLLYWGYTLAAASWPGDGEVGQPGPTIDINLNTRRSDGSEITYTTGQKTYNMVHEIGHCLGFRHTNWSGLGESTGIGIPGTPNSGVNPDPNSVMNGGTAENSWGSFSNFDIIAVREIYPPVPAAPTNGTLRDLGGALIFTWTASTSNVTGYVIAQHSPVGRVLDTISSTSTGFPVHSYLRNGTNIFSVKAISDAGISSGFTVGTYYQSPGNPLNVKMQLFGTANVITWSAATSAVSGYTIKQNMPYNRTVGTTTGTSFYVNPFCATGTNAFTVYSKDRFGLLSSGVTVGCYF